MERLYSILTDDAVERDLLQEEFYFLSDDLLALFKRWQGYDSEAYFPGSRIEQAYLILAECESGMRRALAEANGMRMPEEPLLPGGAIFVLANDNGQPGETVVVQTYFPRSSPPKG